MNEVRCPYCKKLLFKTSEEYEFVKEKGNTEILCDKCKRLIHFEIKISIEKSKIASSQ